MSSDFRRDIGNKIYAHFTPTIAQFQSNSLKMFIANDRLEPKVVTFFKIAKVCFQGAVGQTESIFGLG